MSKGANGATIPKVTNVNCFKRDLNHIMQPAQTLGATATTITFPMYDDNCTTFAALQAKIEVASEEGSGSEIICDYLNTLE